MDIVWTKRAFQRLLEIEEFIAKDDTLAAQSHTDRLLSETEKLSGFPKMGRKLPEIPGSGLRELIMRNYRIVYRIHHQSIPNKRDSIPICSSFGAKSVFNCRINHSDF